MAFHEATDKQNFNSVKISRAMSMSVKDAVLARRSTRAFLPAPVPISLIRDVVETAMRSPSGGNVQPWRLFILHGETMKRFQEMMREKLDRNPFGEQPEYNVYPENLWEPYRSWRFEVGEAMYSCIGIAREAKTDRLKWLLNNYRFFGATTAVFCFVDRGMGPPQWADLGMYLQTAMLLFEEAGLSTCAQEAWVRWSSTVKQFVSAPMELMLFCGLAIGFRDEDAPVNRLRSSRARVDEIAKFV